MKIKELLGVVFDDVVIYRTKGEDFEDIYQGNARCIPFNILEMEVKSIGAKRKGIVDIKVC